MASDDGVEWVMVDRSEPIDSLDEAYKVGRDNDLKFVKTGDQVVAISKTTGEQRFVVVNGQVRFLTRERLGAKKK